jgi:hypothetical protein
VRRALIVLLLVAAGAAAVLTVQAATRVSRADPNGVAVICDPRLAHCWQAGDSVRAPRDLEICAGDLRPPRVWIQAAASSDARAGWMFTCGQATD